MPAARTAVADRSVAAATVQQGGGITMKHTCENGSRCEPCMQLEVDLWDAINHYAVTVGGDPSRHIYGHDARMQAVADVGKVLARVRSRERIDDIVVDELVRGSNAAAGAACKLTSEVARLREALVEVRGFLRGVARRPELGSGAQDLLDEAEVVDRALGKIKEPREEVSL
jgi:hypothetical protein